jgi:beta-lactamase class A
MSRIYLSALLAASIGALAAEKPAFRNSEHLEKLVRDTAASAVERFGAAGLTADKIAITVIDLADAKNPARASYRGEEPMYPASVVKLFYLAAAHHQMEAGTLALTPELERALHDMIVDSSNDATHYVVDMLTGTTAGPELNDVALRDWMEKRNSMNRYFAGLGYDKINVDQKPWCEGPYGRERQGLGSNFENRNRLTTDAVARLWYEIVTGRAASPAGTRAMMNLLHRDPFAKYEDPDDQATAYSGKSLPAGAQYYSKAGWTSDTRHDTAYIRLPNGAEYILAVFTVNNSKQTDIIPFVSQRVAQDFLKAAPKADLALLSGRIWTGDAAQPLGGSRRCARGTDHCRRLGRRCAKARLCVDARYQPGWPAGSARLYRWPRALHHWRLSAALGRSPRCPYSTGICVAYWRASVSWDPSAGSLAVTGTTSYGPARRCPRRT